MPNQIVDQQSPPAHPQTFAHKLCQLLFVKMMGEKAATDQIESAIGERQGQRIGYNAVIAPTEIFSGKMRACPIQQRHIQLNPATR